MYCKNSHLVSGWSLVYVVSLMFTTFRKCIKYFSGRGNGKLQKWLWRSKRTEHSAFFSNLLCVTKHSQCPAQLLSRVRLFETPQTAACQASLSITNSWSLLGLMSIESVMAFNHLILWQPFLLLPSTFPSIRVKSLWDSPHFIQQSLIWGFTRKPMKKCSENSNFMTCHAIDKVHLKIFVQNYFMQCSIAPFVSSVH